MERLLHGEPFKVKTKVAGKAINLTFEGIVSRFRSKYITRDIKTLSERTQKAVAPFLTFGPCHLCRGTRLSQAALSSKIHGHNIAQLATMEISISDLVGVVRAIKSAEGAPIVATLVERLEQLIDIGLEYLTLSCETDTLSGGESLRVKIVEHLGSSLVDVMYIFDELSIGLHPRDVHRMNTPDTVSFEASACRPVTAVAGAVYRRLGTPADDTQWAPVIARME